MRNKHSLVKKRKPAISLPSWGLTGWMWVRRYRVADTNACSSRMAACHHANSSQLCIRLGSAEGLCTSKAQTCL